jgi:hypothetical protein
MSPPNMRACGIRKHNQMTQCWDDMGSAQHPSAQPSNIKSPTHPGGTREATTRQLNANIPIGSFHPLMAALLRKHSTATITLPQHGTDMSLTGEQTSSGCVAGRLPLTQSPP